MARRRSNRRVPGAAVARVGRARRALTGLVALAALAGGVGQATPAASAGDPRARRSALLLEAAELTDRLEASAAGVVTAQLARSRTTGDLSALRARMRTRAVTAYMRGTGASVAALAAPRAYLDVVAAKEQELLGGYRRALVDATAGQRRAEAARADLRAARRQLGAVQAELDAVIAADDARRAAALAARRGPAGATPWGSDTPSPLDPDALQPRHRAATDRQLALMRRIPFGPLGPGVFLPAGLVPTGQRVEGAASWYGPGFNGRPTASGAIYDQEAWTVASRELPLGTLVVVARGDRRVLLLVNDRGPYVDGRVLDLSAAAARALGVGGVAPVTAEVVAGS